MKHFLIQLYLRYRWKVDAKKSHAQRRYDQIITLIKWCTSVQQLKTEYTQMINEYEENFGNEYGADDLVIQLCHTLEHRINYLLNKQDKTLIYS